MATLQDLLARAQALREETALGSISPERAGSIMYDTLQVINQMQLNGGSLVINKIYATVAAMEADTAPVSDLTGSALKPGQLVVIVTSDTSSADFGSVYRFDGIEDGASSWSLTGKIGSLPVADNLTTDNPAIPLSAAQGVVIDGKISQIVREVDGDLGWVNGYLINGTTLQPQASANYRYSRPIYFGAGVQFNIKTGGSGVALLSRADKNGNLSSALLKSVSGGSNYAYTTDSEGYIVLCYKYTDADASLEIDSTPIADYVFPFSLKGGSLMSKQMRGLISADLYTIAWENKIVAASSLTPSTNASYRFSPPIFAKAGTIINVNTAGAGIGVICSCNQSGTLLAALVASPSGASTTENSLYHYKCTADIYIRICYKFSVADSYVEILDGNYNVWRHINAIEDLDKTQEARIKAVETALGYKKLKILVLGNSYAADSWFYVPFILKNYGIDVEIMMYYRGALSLENLYNRWESDAEQDTETGLNAGTYTRYRYYIDTEINTTWTRPTRLSAKACVEIGGWDIISMQQWSGYSLDFTYYEPYANDIINLIRQSLATPYTLAWNMVATRPTYDNIPASIAAQKELYETEPCSLFLPWGTAIFNARTNPTLAALGDYSGHNLWCSDGVHFQEGIPKYIASLAIVQALFDRYYRGLSVLGDISVPNATLWSPYEKRGDSVGVTDANRYLAQKCAIQANKFPFEVTTI